MGLGEPGIFVKSPVSFSFPSRLFVWGEIACVIVDWVCDVMRSGVEFCLAYVSTIVTILGGRRWLISDGMSNRKAIRYHLPHTPPLKHRRVV